MCFKKYSLLFLFIIHAITNFGQAPVVCDLAYITTIQTFDVFHHVPSGATMYKAKMYIDADGSPQAYGPGDSGLDWTANAGHPGNWWGIVTDGGGTPILQNASDPYPGMYVSTTSLVNAAYATTNPLRYVNSEAVPFFVLPSPVVSSGGIHIGDIGYVYNTLTGLGCFAIYADAGPTASLGEGSIYLASQIGVDPNARTGGTSSGVIDYIVFPNSGYGQGTIPTLAQIDSIGNYQLNLIGGVGIVACLGGPDLIQPTTAIDAPLGWVTTDFNANFTDIDNISGSGIQTSFYQVLENNGTEWRGNNGNGFFADNFDAAIHSDWTSASGTWAINSGYLSQTDQTNSNSNIWALLAQDSINCYLYNWQGKINGTGTNRRAGFHFFCDDPTLSNRGNSYFVYFRVDGSVCQFYKVTGNIFTLVHSVAMTVVADQWYDYKVTYHPGTGEIKVYKDDSFVGSWMDPAPLTNGNSISFRNGNADYSVNDLKVFRSRPLSVNVSVGAISTNDVRYQNQNPLTSACQINSITEDSSGNLSTIVSQDVNVDWSLPSPVIISDGASLDIDTTFLLDQLSANWSLSLDTNSAIAAYYYSIGTTLGGTDVLDWVNNAMSNSMTESGLSLIPSQTYFISVRSQNGAGLMSDIVSSDGQRVVIPGAGIANDPDGFQFMLYPNPFIETATVSYNLENASDVEIILIDLLGNQIILHPKENMKIGPHSFVIQKEEINLASGMYMLKFVANNKTRVIKLNIQ